MIRFALIRFTGVVALLLWLKVPVWAEDWDEKWYNPKPAEEDLTLPLPCGGKMVFRPVDVPGAAEPLTDRPVVLGDPEVDPSGFIEYVRNGYLAAPFKAPDGGRRYYIGKYTVTRDQFAAMTQPLTRAECAPPSAAGRVAMNAVAYINAMTSAATWSSWLLANARESLPKRGEAFAFARLPTEDEWEYAARGGAKVSEQEFLGRTWSMPEGIERYAMAGSRQAGGRVQQVGQLLPNPLGLYDMLGNVAQMTVEPFRLNRVGRPHGQAGGVVARGGNYTSPPASLHTAMRVEIPPYDPTANAPTALATVGFRLVLSATTVDGLPETEAMRKAFVVASAQGQADADTNDPRRLIARMKDLTADNALRQGLERLEARLAQENRGRGDEASAALGAQLEAATVMANFVWTIELNANLQEEFANTLFQNRPDDKKAILTMAAQRRSEQRASLDGYLRLLRLIAFGPGRGAVTQQIGVLRSEFDNRNEKRLIAFIPVIERHASLLGGGTRLSPEQARADILAVQSR